MFQAGVLQMNDEVMPMIVCGTGGASPDISGSSRRTFKSPLQGSLTYKMVYNASPYGYCRFNVDWAKGNNTITIDYVNVKKKAGAEQKTNVVATFEISKVDDRLVLKKKPKIYVG
jgi:hypothetical protein